jgi:hypothetical protein
MTSWVRLKVVECSAGMRRMAVLVSLVVAIGAPMTLYAPSRAEAACVSAPCCDEVIDDHWADPACEPQRHSPLPAALGIVGLVAAGGLLLVFASRVRRATSLSPSAKR